MKNQILGLALVVASIFSANAQEKLMTRTGSVTFLSSTPMETFEAKNNQVASIITTNDNVLAFNVLMKSFKFEKALMEEHFNEKYVHSDKYPAAKFKGVIPSSVDLSAPNTHKGVEIKGEMIFHGVTKPVMVVGDIVVNADKSVSFNSSFDLKLADYNVEIPSLVKEKISESVTVAVATSYK